MAKVSDGRKKPKQLEDQKFLYEYADTEKIWYENINSLRRKRPLKPYVVNIKPLIDDNIDELMMMVSTELTWTISEMENLGIIRFLKVVNSVKRKIKTRNEAMEKGPNKDQKN